MSKIKETLLNGLTQEELENELFHRYQDQYDEWLESEDYVNYINDIIEETKPVFSSDDLNRALEYASQMVTIEPSEVGKKVYDMLFSEKIQEYLNSHRNGF
jgi:hypothetical protein